MDAEFEELKEKVKAATKICMRTIEGNCHTCPYGGGDGCTFKLREDALKVIECMEARK